MPSPFLTLLSLGITLTSKSNHSFVVGSGTKVVHLVKFMKYGVYNETHTHTVIDKKDNVSSTVCLMP